jgi:hypothetical protein
MSATRLTLTVAFFTALFLDIHAPAGPAANLLRLAGGGGGVDRSPRWFTILDD